MFWFGAVLAIWMIFFVHSVWRDSECRKQFKVLRQGWLTMHCDDPYR
jgi:hypothetical protein